MFAIAMDLGTTTLAVSLIETTTGKRLTMSGAMNPQRCFGADVVSRLDAAVHDAATLREMSRLIRSELLRLAREVCDKSSVAWEQIEQFAIAGNPAMQHILLELPVHTLAFPPYRPSNTAGQTVTAEDLGWPGCATIYIFPMPGGFVGGDTVAFLFGQMGGHSEPVQPARLFLDMGTNGEMALTAGGTIWATSAAAGPAFEGGNLSCGMAALPGAINTVRVAGDRLKLETIGNCPPIGICGSAAIEVVHELMRREIIEPSGRLLGSHEITSNLANRIIEHDNENAFVLYRDVRGQFLLTQGDIRQIQLAKAAIRAGMEVLADKSCIQCNALDEVVLTGSFGAVLKPEWLKSIGVFDEGMVHITRFTPEGALAGAEKALCSNECMRAVEDLACRMRVIPLSGTPLFEELFIRNIDFPRL